MNRLLKKGTSPKLRKKVVVRYSILFIFYMISIADAIDDQIDLVHGLFPNEGTDRFIQNTLYFILNINGFFIAIVRLSEPYVFEQLKKIFKKTEQKKSDKYAEESLCHFVNSVMNIEFVYLILIGIDNFFGRNIDAISNDSKINITKGVDRITVLSISQVSYKDIDKWDVKEAPEDETMRFRKESIKRNSINEDMSIIARNSSEIPEDKKTFSSARIERHNS